MARRPPRQSTNARSVAAEPTAPRTGSRLATHYRDFVIRARRRDSKRIEVCVEQSTAGRSRPVAVAFSQAEEAAIRDSFGGIAPGARVTGRVSLTSNGSQARRGNPSGRMLITQEEATSLGKRLAEVLFPAAIFQRLAESVSRCVKEDGGGVRIRLACDGSLIDLPWEYAYRGDRLEASGLSGFLLLDPRISMVRMAADPRLSSTPVTGRERLAFVGTLWDRQRDEWDVRGEFDRLKTALAPVASYITPKFMVAADDRAFTSHLGRGAAIFHYAGHCDFEADGRPFIIRELDPTASLATIPKLHLDDLAAKLRRSPVRLCVMSACNSGFWPAVEPLLAAGIPALIGINGIVASASTIEFCVKLYESLAIGLSLDEAVGRARVHVMEWGRQQGLFDWGLYMTYMPSADAALFPRATSTAVVSRQTRVRREHAKAIDASLARAKRLDGVHFGEIMSELTQRRVLILGRFSERRLKVLKAIQATLAGHPNQYVPELFTFRKPKNRDLVESIMGFAALSRFIIADLSEPKSVQSELEAIVPHFQSVPVVPVINQTGREYATFASVRRRPNVIQPTVRYRGIEDLIAKLDTTIVPEAEAKLRAVVVD